MSKKNKIEELKKLRERTGLGMLDCKQALEEAEGDQEKALKLLRKKGASIASKRAEKSTGEGGVFSYIHPGNKIGVLVEIDCETDFVANTKEFKDFANDIAMHIAASKAMYISPDKIDLKVLDREKQLYKEEFLESGESDKDMEKFIEDKLAKFFEEVCLLNQSFIKNDQKTIEDMLKELIAKTGENILIKRFARYEVGI